MYDALLPAGMFLGTISLKGSQTGGSVSKDPEEEPPLKKSKHSETTTPLVQTNKYSLSLFFPLFFDTNNHLFK